MAIGHPVPRALLLRVISSEKRNADDDISGPLPGTTSYVRLTMFRTRPHARISVPAGHAAQFRSNPSDARESGTLYHPLRLKMFGTSQFSSGRTCSSIQKRTKFSNFGGVNSVGDGLPFGGAVWNIFPAPSGCTVAGQAQIQRGIGGVVAEIVFLTNRNITLTPT